MNDAGPHDFRSDTVTRPTPAMRQAMAAADVGDDVFGDDPTMQELEAEVAALFGRDAALFTPTGSQANQIAARIHARSGEEVALGSGSHSFDWELAALASLSGLQARTVPAERGVMDADAVAATLRPAGGFRPACRLLIVENTHNFHGGAVVPFAHLERLHGIARERDARVHLDGARLWNAAVASGTPLEDYGRVADSIAVCLSKGLGAPIGSLLVGDRAFIDEARHVRKMMGGGMRQVGVLAAPGLVAVREHRARLADDHARARALADGFAALPGVTFPYGAPDTNILFVDFGDADAPALQQALEARGVRAIATGPHVMRFVTHYDVGDAAVTAAIDAVRAGLAP